MLNINDTQEMIRNTAARFAAERIAPNARRWERDGMPPMDTLREMGRLGFLGMNVPERWGGAELDYVSYALALIEIAAGDGSLSTIMSVQNGLVCSIFLNEANDSLKSRYLSQLASGDMIGAFALSEPQAGSDAANIRTRAVRSANSYLISGTKQFITSGKIAGIIIVFAVTDPSAGKRGITAFAVPADSPGLEVSNLEHKLGQQASDTAQLTFTDVAVSKDLRIGEEGDGYRIALANLATGRIGIGAQSVGMAQAALKCAVEYCGEREAFDRRLFDHQAIAFRLADMKTKLEVARSMVLHVAALKDANRSCLEDASIAKLFASEAAEEICSAAIQCLGGYGYTTDFPVEKIYRDVRVCQIYEGTSDVQRMVIARGLEKEYL